MSKKIIREQLEISPYIQAFGTTGDCAPKMIHCAECRDGSGKIDMWLEVEPHSWLGEVDRGNSGSNEYLFYTAATGERVNDDWEHQGTVIMNSGLAWHIYKLP